MICFRKIFICFRYSQKYMHTTKNQNQLHVILGILVCRVKISSIVLLNFTLKPKNKTPAVMVGCHGDGN